MDGVGGVCCVYDDDVWLPFMVESCYPAVDRLTFLVGRQPWNGDAGCNSKTIEAITSCPDPDKKIAIIEGDWSTETVQRNAGLALCVKARLSYCFVVDADEIYDPNTLRFLIDVACTRPSIDVWHIRWFTYWKSYRFRIEPIEPSRPPVLIRIGNASFRNSRIASGRSTGHFPPKLGMCHHLSYARNDEQIRKKITRFSHAHQILPHWFDAIWLGWDQDPNLENIHPIWPTYYRKAVPQDPRLYPPVLRRLFERDHGSVPIDA